MTQVPRQSLTRQFILRSAAAAPEEFKEFRTSVDFKPIATEICDAVRRILQDCARSESGFCTADIPSILGEYEKGECDFNDQILTELCKSQGWTLVTDDGDFKSTGLQLVSANRKLLF